MATSTVEDYLKCILLEQQHCSGLVPMGRIAAALSVASATVTAMVKALSESHLVVYEPYVGVQLTEAGRQLATHVLRRHRLIELFLVEVMGMDWGEVHEEAEQLEHALSDRLMERMDEMLGHPEVDPHGDPIPSAHGELRESEHLSLLSCPLNHPLRISRVRDQSSAFLRLVELRGLMPGSQIQVTSKDEAAETLELLLEASGEQLSLGFGPAAKILAESLH